MNPLPPKASKGRASGFHSMPDLDSQDLSLGLSEQCLLPFVLLNWKQAGGALELTHFRRFPKQDSLKLELSLLCTSLGKSISALCVVSSVVDSIFK